METKSPKIVKYIDRLNSTEEEKNVESNKLKNTEADINLQTAILTTQKRISELTGMLEANKGASPYAPDQIYLLKSKIDVAERELKFYEELRKEQF